MDYEKVEGENKSTIEQWERDYINICLPALKGLAKKYGTNFELLLVVNMDEFYMDHIIILN